MSGNVLASDLRVLVATDVLQESGDGVSPGKDALGLLIDLLPPGSQAGIWTYNDSVASLAQYGILDEHWRASATRALRELSAPPNRPPINLETALVAAASKWRESGRERHLILIMSPEPPSADVRPAVQRSRARIMAEAIPVLRAARVRIHVITYGSGEIPLAGRLAAASGGLLLHAARGEELTARILELAQVLRPLELPVRHGEIIVDQGIARMTLALLRDPADPASELRTPDGRRYRADSPAAGMRWQQAPGHEIVIIDKPEAGVWRIDAANAEVHAWFEGTPLLSAARIPLRALAGDRLTLQAALQESAGEALLTVQHQGPDEDPRLLERGTASKDKPLRIELPRDLAPGVHWLAIEASGSSFQRTWRQRVEVLESPLHLEFSRNKGKPLLSLVPWADILRHDDLHIAATLTDGKRFVARLQAERTSPQEWQLDLTEHQGPRLLQLTLETAGTRSPGGVLLHQDRPRGFDALGLHEPEPLPTRKAAPPAPPAPKASEGSVTQPIMGSGLLMAGAFVLLVSTLGIAVLLERLLRGPERAAVAARSAPSARPSAQAKAQPANVSPSAVSLTEPQDPAPAPKPQPAPKAPETVMYFSDETVLPEEEAAVTTIERVPEQRKESPPMASSASDNDPLADIDIAGIELDFSEEAAASTA